MYWLANLHHVSTNTVKIAETFKSIGWRDRKWTSWHRPGAAAKMEDGHFWGWLLLWLVEQRESGLSHSLSLVNKFQGYVWTILTYRSFLQRLWLWLGMRLWRSWQGLGQECTHAPGPNPSSKIAYEIGRWRVSKSQVQSATWCIQINEWSWWTKSPQCLIGN